MKKLYIICSAIALTTSVYASEPEAANDEDMGLNNLFAEPEVAKKQEAPKKKAQMNAPNLSKKKKKLENAHTKNTVILGKIEKAITDNSAKLEALVAKRKRLLEAKRKFEESDKPIETALTVVRVLESLNSTPQSADVEG